MLDQLQPKPGSRKPRRRKGRGIGSGNGKTAGRGTKGAGARSGNRKRAWYESGSLPLQMRLPKFGFNNKWRVEHQIVNLGALGRVSDADVVDASVLAKAGLIRRADQPVKVLAQGELSGAVKLRVNAISAGARKKLEAAGGSVEIIQTPSKGGEA